MAPSSNATSSSSAGADRMVDSVWLATQSTSVAIGTLLVLTRIYIRSIIIKKIGLDDMFIVIGLVIALVVCAMTSLSVHYIQQYFSDRSHGQTVAAISNFTLAQKLLALSLPVGIFSGLCTRLSVCLFLLRIFRSIRAWRWGLYAVMAFATAVVIPTHIILLAHCQPIRKQWDPLSPGTCWSPLILSRTSYAYGVTSVLCDWILATLPIVFMWNLQMRVRVKVGICALMGMGYFTGICALVRTLLDKEQPFLKPTDEYLQSGPAQKAIWAILEVNVGIIAACIPTLKPLFDHSRPSHLRFFRSDKAADTPELDDDKACRKILTLNTLESTLPSSLANSLNSSGDSRVSQARYDGASDAASPPDSRV
ncbi:hypothetical protein HO173_012963 [Letharia columbiana]|uniref:Rhodopsin domain-containing protein n=1 Tax=Letharia columbiana TaxID=112416 RepID=A0A8H6CJQ1_9LECA|nr:uncharacterized protein HO173_012963 [Letharia columbiana]KAF6224620.1 hypothetical protein HO173_012963 [Letharia columbiana]